METTPSPTTGIARPPQLALARVVADPAFVLAPVRPRLFGSFVEHMGRCVYTGVYEPDHPTADEHGFRADVAGLVDELGVTMVRYPGGNFVSNYRWEDGVGPREERPVTLDLAWRAIEPNQVGTDDFLGWCERIGVEPMMAVNLGTRGLAEAVDLLQYTNAEPGLATADRRVANGRTEPWDVRLWCLGNEMDGPWQMGHKTPEEYARVAEEVGRAMKRFDPTLELVACGSSNRSMPTFGTWERVVLEQAFDQVDHISAHAYYEPVDGDVDSFLASAEDMERFIDAVVATADHVAAVRGSDRRIDVSFDEWNVWYQSRFPGELGLDIRDVAPLIEDVYDLTDAVVVGSLLITLLRHTDRVSMACQAQLVNVIAPIMTEPGGPAWRQTIFHPFALTARHARGTVLRLAVDSPLVATARYGEVDQLHTVATWDETTGELVVLAVNRGLVGDLTLDLDLSRFGDLSLVEHLVLTDADPAATNTAAQPERVVPRPGDATLDDGRLTASLPAVSWHCLRLSAAPSTTPAPLDRSSARDESPTDGRNH
ncbi:arabinosylfuranosidase ArfA [Auraticoccus monumenti]|uniref:arabinosylfuranosidase ArfA n=1 Tax=Auraticoccus monumenti TaxID=675864 RepID=UPI001E636A20|nr:alpha-N-arabinofuranosidase [Auraticoccus monumenti]